MNPDLFDTLTKKANEIARPFNGRNPAVGEQHHETMKTKSIRAGVKKNWLRLTDEQKLAGVAVTLFALLVWLAIHAAPLMR